MFLISIFPVKIDSDELKKEWLSTGAPAHIKLAAEHYQVFQDLFGYAYFTPYVLLDVTYKQDDGLLAPVYRGNVVKPQEATRQPDVKFSSDPDSLWTLVLTTPDGHLSELNKEYVHWMV